MNPRSDQTAKESEHAISLRWVTHPKLLRPIIGELKTLYGWLPFFSLKELSKVKSDHKKISYWLISDHKAVGLTFD